MNTATQPQAFIASFYLNAIEVERWKDELFIDGSKALRPTEAAARLSLTEADFRKLWAAGKLRLVQYKIDGECFYRAEDVSVYLDDRFEETWDRTIFTEDGVALICEPLDKGEYRQTIRDARLSYAHQLRIRRKLGVVPWLPPKESRPA